MAGVTDHRAFSGKALSGSNRGQRAVSLDAKLANVRRLSKLMDSQFRVPGTAIKFGFDSIVGLIPGVGDAVTIVVPLWVLYQAHSSGVRKRTLARMLGNIAVDATVGVVPVLGDIFDVYWKANVRNLRLLESELNKTKAGKASS